MKEFRLFDNVLHFEGLDSETHVARSTSMRRLADRDLESAGFDPETLKLQWLDPGTLILLTWGTVPQGQGRHSKEGNLIPSVPGPTPPRALPRQHVRIWPLGRPGLFRVPFHHRL